MIYTSMTKAAMKLCFEAHKEQFDKSGMPYVFHPFHLAEQMESEEAICVALLHDVMEDTDLDVGDIRAAGMSDAVVAALLLMTHDSEIEYMDYVERLSCNPLARKVKMADLRHNMDTARLDAISDKDRERVAKYRRAYSMLAKAEARYELERTQDAIRDQCRSVLDIRDWCSFLLERGVDPETKVVKDRSPGLEGYTYVDDLYCDDSRPEGAVVLLGSYKVRAKAWNLMPK